MSMDRFVPIVLIAVGILNLLPGVVALAPDRVQVLYGITIDGSTLAVLLRHRAVLLALVGMALIWGAVSPKVRIPALIAALISKLTFLALWWATPDTGAPLARVAFVDVVALVLVGAVLAIEMRGAEPRAVCR